MLSTAQVHDIKRLRREGRSYRAIARITGRSLDTVHRVLTGRRSPVRAATRQERRCPGCGGKVIGTCLACEARRFVAARAA